MKRLILLAVALGVFALGPTVAGQWAPPHPLNTVPVFDNCWATAGDIGRAAITPYGSAIYLCSQRAFQLDSVYPGASEFYRVHEYGHVFFQNGDEPAADCWAAQQLARVPGGQAIIAAAARHFWDRRFEMVDPRYGAMAERARRVATCGGLQ